MRLLVPVFISAVVLIAAPMPCAADPRADAILREAKAAAQAARTIDGAAIYTVSEPGQFTCDITSVRFEKPNRFNIQTWSNLHSVPNVNENIAKLPHVTVIGNGKYLWTTDEVGRVTRRLQTAKLIAASNIPNELDMFRLVHQPGPGPFTGSAKRTYGGKRNWNGELCDVVHVRNPDFKGELAVSDLYFDAKHILRAESGTECDGLWKVHTTYTRFGLDAPLPPGTFDFRVHRYERTPKMRVQAEVGS